MKSFGSGAVTAPYKEGAGLQEVAHFGQNVQLFMGVSKLVESVLFWTLIIVPSFCTRGQIQTGDNFGGLEEFRRLQ